MFYKALHSLTYLEVTGQVHTMIEECDLLSSVLGALILSWHHNS